MKSFLPTYLPSAADPWNEAFEKKMNEHSRTVSELIKGDDNAGWLVTYADLMTLLLSFFVLLFSISSMDLQKFKQAVASIQISLGEHTPPVGLIELIPKPRSIMEPASERLRTERISGLHQSHRKIILENVIGFKSKNIFRDVQSFIQKRDMSDNIAVSIEQSKVVIRITGRVLFESGWAILNPSAKLVLDDIIEIINRYPEYVVRIEGHTDDIPISTKHFASNWELSAVRATTVLRYLVERGISPRRLTATGYGELVPLVPNTTEHNRSCNRRVEFVLEKKAK